MSQETHSTRPIYLRRRHNQSIQNYSCLTITPQNPFSDVKAYIELAFYKSSNSFVSCRTCVFDITPINQHQSKYVRLQVRNSRPPGVRLSNFKNMSNSTPINTVDSEQTVVVPKAFNIPDANGQNQSKLVSLQEVNSKSMQVIDICEH